MILNTYPPDGAKFLGKEKDRFANPVGYAISQGAESLLNWLSGKDEPNGEISLALDDIIRIRAVQNFSPSEALAFIFLLKKAVREELGGEIARDKRFEEFLELESKIDELAMSSFDIYMKCREKLYEIRVKEFKNRLFHLLERANLIYEIPEWKTDFSHDKTDQVE